MNQIDLTKGTNPVPRDLIKDSPSSIAKMLKFLSEESTRDERLYIFNKDENFIFFALYYFPEYFQYKLADFHYEMFKDLTFKEWQYLVWCAFRESGKTSLAKIYIVWCICNNKKRFINYDCYDKKNAESNLFDIARALQTNQALIEDYGQLFFEKESEVSTKKSIGEFVTANEIKVKAFSTQEPTRGRVYGRFRPDLFVLDDFENSKTAKSEVRTAEVISHIKELFGGLSGHASVIFLCNLIHEDGSVARIMREGRDNRSYKVREIPVYKGEYLLGEITWKDKYVWTDDEAALANLHIKDPLKRKISIEGKMRDLNVGGENNFDPEMLNKPNALGSRYFICDQTPIDALFSNRAWNIYGTPTNQHRYATGADISLGVGDDSSAAVCIDFSHKVGDQVIPKVVATYADNSIAPDRFAYELKYIGELFGKHLVAPEANNVGWATLTELKRMYFHIYSRKDKSEFTDQDTQKLGFLTTSATKPEILSQLRSAIQDGLIILSDERLINEVKMYTSSDARSNKTATRHFDMVMALAIAWEMRHHAIPCTIEEAGVNYKPIDYDKHAVL
jgi:hypothetical protein